MTDAPLNEAPPAVWQLDVEPGAEEAAAEVSVAVEEPARPAAEADTSPPPPLERIVEALLFVAGEPVTAERFCQIIRGLDVEHLHACVRQLNQSYRRQGRPYVIEQHGGGHRLALRPRYRGVVEQLYGGVKEARFSAAAVETLAVVAYRQPVARAGVDAVRGQESDGPLRQLLRRGLVTLQGKDANHQPLYGTTPRFLEFFQLKKLDELPRADDLPAG